MDITTTIRIWRRDTNYTVQTYPIEWYLRGVVPAEMLINWHWDAYMAQAIAARSYAFYHTFYPKHARVGADLCTETCCQVFRPYFRTITDAAVAASAGRILRKKAANAIFETFYSACCGGTIRGCACRRAFRPCIRNGHGWGLCQYGAEQMAREGATWREILAFYYPDAYVTGAKEEMTDAEIRLVILAQFARHYPFDLQKWGNVVPTCPWQHHPEHALSAAAHSNQLGMPPLTDEHDVVIKDGRTLRYQFYPEGVTWCKVNDWDNVKVIFY